MTMKNRKYASIALITLCLSMFCSISFAFYHTKYESLSHVKDHLCSSLTDNNCRFMQGMAVGSKYIYCAKINGDGWAKHLGRDGRALMKKNSIHVPGVTDNRELDDLDIGFEDTRCFIRRINIENGSSTWLKDADPNSGDDANYLGHANDMAVTSSTKSGHSTLFVATMQKGDHSLVKLDVNHSDRTFKKIGHYTITLNGKPKSISGIEITGRTDGNVNFLFKSGTHFYRGHVGVSQHDGTVRDFSDAFRVAVDGAKVKSLTVNAKHYNKQGFGVYKNRLYFPISGNVEAKGSNKGNKNVSIILVYDNINNASGTIQPSADSFRITSSMYPYEFELESCDVHKADGRLYFSANRAKKEGDENHDCIGYFIIKKGEAFNANTEK